MAQTGFTDQRRCMGRGLTVMNLPANDQPAKDIHHQVQTIELTTHCSGQECDIPRPNLARCGGGPGARPFGHMGRSSAAPMIHLFMLTQHSVKARFAGNIDSLIGQRSEEHTSELQSLIRISYDVFGLKKKKNYI